MSIISKIVKTVAKGVRNAASKRYGKKVVKNAKNSIFCKMPKTEQTAFDPNQTTYINRRTGHGVNVPKNWKG